MEPSKYFVIKVVLPENQGWMPGMVLFQADNTFKGIAVFTSWVKANDFKSFFNFDGDGFSTEVSELGRDGMLLTQFFSGVVNAVRSEKKALIDIPVYIDPPDLYCKGLSVSFNSLQSFIREAMAHEIEWETEVVSFEMYRGFTIALHQRRGDHLFGCVALRGEFKDRNEMGKAAEAIDGTTDAKYHLATGFAPFADEVQAAIKRGIDQVLA